MLDTELSHLKALPLETYAASLGYFRDPVKSSRKVAVLRREADDDKLLVTVSQDGHWVYRSERDHADKGSILDFAMTRGGFNLGEARRELRNWANLPSHTAQKPVKAPAPLVQAYDRAKANQIWNVLTRKAVISYLLNARSIPLSTLTDPRFADCWRQHRAGSATFPSWDRQGLCGLEFRGEGVKWFLTGCQKGLWVSANVKTCSRLVVCEGPIDALSYHALHGLDAADQAWPLGYVATGGKISTLQKELLADLISHCADRGCAIVAAFDNDPSGDEMIHLLPELAFPVERHLPVGKDWNCDLQYVVRENGGAS